MKIAEEQKASHISVVQLEELYQISRAEADFGKNMKVDIKQLLQELRALILSNVPDSTQQLSVIAKLDLSRNNIVVNVTLQRVDNRKYNFFVIFVITE